MTIGELAQRAGVTTRTIRYYVEQGLLPPPDRGRPAEYTDEHVRRLELIRRLKEQYLPLEEIRDTMQRLRLEQVDELLAAHGPPPEQETRRLLTTAADYITDVLNRGAAREQLKRMAPPQTLIPPQPPVPPLVAPGAPPTPETPPAMPAVPAPEWQPPYPMAPAPTRRLEPVVPLPPQIVTAPAQSAYTNQTSTWQRIPLAPGIELHYTATGDARLNEIVDRLVEAAGRILDAFPENVVEEP